MRKESSIENRLGKESQVCRPYIYLEVGSLAVATNSCTRENPEALIEIGIQAEQLHYGNAIARQYLLKYDLSER